MNWKGRLNIKIIKITSELYFKRTTSISWLKWLKNLNFHRSFSLDYVSVYIKNQNTKIKTQNDSQKSSQHNSQKNSEQNSHKNSGQRPGKMIHNINQNIHQQSKNTKISKHDKKTEKKSVAYIFNRDQRVSKSQSKELDKYIYLWRNSQIYHSNRKSRDG